MQFRIFKISSSGDSAAEEAMNHFLRAHRVVSVSKELVQSPEGVRGASALNISRETKIREENVLSARNPTGSITRKSFPMPILRST